jgi:hypothetical protein
LKKDVSSFFVNSASAGDESHTAGKKELRERQSIHISTTGQRVALFLRLLFSLACIACVCAYLFICKSRVVGDAQPSNRKAYFSFASPNKKLERTKVSASASNIISAAQQSFFSYVRNYFIPGTRYK